MKYVKLFLLIAFLVVTSFGQTTQPSKVATPTQIPVSLWTLVSKLKDSKMCNGLELNIRESRRATFCPQN